MQVTLGAALRQPNPASVVAAVDSDALHLHLVASVETECRIDRGLIECFGRHRVDPDSCHLLIAIEGDPEPDVQFVVAVNLPDGPPTMKPWQAGSGHTPKTILAMCVAAAPVPEATSLGRHGESGHRRWMMLAVMSLA